MNIERPGSPSATTVAPTSKRRSTSIETKRSRLASERPPKKGVASKNAFRSGELTAIDLNILPLPAAASGPSPTDVSALARGGRRSRLPVRLACSWQSVYKIRHELGYERRSTAQETMVRRTERCGDRSPSRL